MHTKVHGHVDTFIHFTTEATYYIYGMQHRVQHVHTLLYTRGGLQAESCRLRWATCKSAALSFLCALVAHMCRIFCCKICVYDM